MSTKKCEVIQDLLPLYIDNICSDESRRIVSEHLESCNECKKLHENMSQTVKQSSKEPELDSKEAFKAINHKWKMKKISITCISVVLTVLVVFIGYTVFQEMSSVHDYFFPVIHVNLKNLPDDEWTSVSFEDTDVLVFDSIFYEKEVTLDANCDGAIHIRISDNSRKIVIDEIMIEPGTSLDLNVLEKDKEYFVEIKTNADFVVLNFH